MTDMDAEYRTEAELEECLRKLVKSIRGADQAAVKAAEERQAKLAKPPGSLGKLEALSIQLAGITGTVKNEVKHRRLLVFAADNGVVREGVACAPQSVTLQQTVNLTHAKTGASVLCRYLGSEITVTDIGVNADVPEERVLNRKLMRGTNDIAEGPAMSRETALRAILIGADIAREACGCAPCGPEVVHRPETGSGTEAERGQQEKPLFAAPFADVLGVGEMGIGNTTTSSAVVSVLLGLDSDVTVGRGGGLTDEGLATKKAVIRRAIARNHPDPADPVDVLSKVGGLDIAAMCGAFLGAASARRPVVIDGFISAAAALAAFRLCPAVRAFLIPSHASCETGYRYAMQAMDLAPMLLLDMRLGEGSGCPLAFQILDAACAVMNHMALFSEAGINDDYLDEIREKKAY